MQTKYAPRTWRTTAANLKKRRLGLDLTLEDVARRLDVTPPTVHRWERGVIKPNATMLRAWEAALFREAP